MTSSFLSRRTLVFAGGAVALGAAGFFAAGGRNAYYAALTEQVDGAQIDAPTAHRRAESGEILLVDIRTPEEWAATGSGAGAVRLDMRRADFASEVLRLAGGDAARPVALICARGVRSARLANLMADAGFSRVIDVPEGMLGSRAGPGWIARGLPMVRG